MMKRFLLLMSALAFAGCFDFGADLETCHRAGGCTRAGDDSGVTDSGLTDAGAVDGGEVDAGLPDAGVADAGASDGGGGLMASPVFLTSTGWGWEFPFPGGPGLHSVAAVNDAEAWATGDDDSVLHYVDGGFFFSRLTPAPAGPLEGGRVLSLPDGGVVIADGTGLYLRAGSGWTRSAFPLSILRAAEVGAAGVPWFGGQWQPSSGPCNPAGSAVVEGVPLGTPLCTSISATQDMVVGLDPLGWGLDNRGQVLRREVDGGVRWKAVAVADGGYYGSGDVLALSSDDVLVVGLNAGSSMVVSLDGGIVPVTFDPMTNPEEWTSLLRTQDQSGFFVAGKPGVYRCEIAVPFLASQCVVELYDESASLETLALAPTTVFGVGGNGQFLHREDDAGWSTLLPGGQRKVNDVWADANGELWAVANGGWLLHGTSAGWERLQVPGVNDHLISVTRTSDGLLWIAGDEFLASYDLTTNSFSNATITSTTGSSLFLPGSGVSLGSLAGTVPGNTWAAGSRMLLGYGTSGSWTQVALPSQTDSISDLWVSDAGTAWAVGGYGTRRVLFWNGSQWLDRTPAGTGIFFSVWGPSGTEAFVSGESNSYHFLSDGGVVPWSLDPGMPATSLSGGPRTDGGFVLFGGRGTLVWRAPNGTLAGTGMETGAPMSGYLTRLRVIGSKVFVTGNRDDPHSFILSLDAGL